MDSITSLSQSLCFAHHISEKVYIRNKRKLKNHDSNNLQKNYIKRRILKIEILNFLICKTIYLLFFDNFKSK